MTLRDGMAKPVEVRSNARLGRIASPWRLPLGVFVQRLHDGAYFRQVSCDARLGYLFVRESEVTHHGGVDHVVLERKNGLRAFCDESPVLGRCFNHEFAELLLLFCPAAEEARYQPWHRADKCSSKGKQGGSDFRSSHGF